MKKRKKLLLIRYLLTFLFIFFCNISFSYNSYDDDWISDYAYPSFKILMDNNIIVGINGKKKPHNNITQAEFLKIVIEVARKFTNLKIELENNNNSKHWADNYINTAIKYGFIDKDLFNPDKYITRLQACDIIVNVFSLNTLLDISDEFYKIFVDVNKNDQVKSLQILWAYDIINGYSNNKIGPNDFITREQTSAILLGKKLPNYPFEIKGVINPKINKLKLSKNNNNQVNNNDFGIFLLNNDNNLLFSNTISNKIMELKIKLQNHTNIKKVIFKKEGLSNNTIFGPFMLYLNNIYIGQSLIDKNNNIIIETNNIPNIYPNQEYILSLRVSIKENAQGSLFKIILQSIVFSDYVSTFNITTDEYKVSMNNVNTQNIVLSKNNIDVYKINNFEKDINSFSFNIKNENSNNDITFSLQELKIYIEGNFNEDELNNFRLLIGNNVVSFGERISKNIIYFNIIPNIQIHKNQSITLNILNDVSINRNNVKYRLYIKSINDITILNNKYNFIENISNNKFPIYSNENFFTN